MTPTELYRSYIDAENARDVDAMAAYLAPGLTVTVNGVPQLADRDEDAEATRQLLERYPDYRRLLHNVFHEGSTVVAEWEMAAPGDPTLGVAPLSVIGCSIVDVEDGVMTTARLYTDPRAIQELLDEAPSDED